MLRFLALAFVAMWALATLGRFTRRLRGKPINPPWQTRVIPEPISSSERRMGMLRTTVVALSALAVGGALFAYTELPDVVIVFAVAPVIGLTNSLAKEWLPSPPRSGG